MDALGLFALRSSPAAVRRVKMKKAQPNSTTNDDQDSAWKELLDECLPDCLEFLFPKIFGAIDWSRPWVSRDKELARLKPPLPGGKLYADKLYQVWLKDGQSKWLLIHAEVQGHARRGFARRVFHYNYRISVKHPEADVVSLVIVTETKRSVEGRYERSALGCSLVFEFPLAQLAMWADRVAELEAHPNPFALAVAVQLKALETRGDNARRLDFKKQFVRRLLERGYARAKIEALFRFMDEAMRLPEALEDEVRETIHQIEEGKKMPYVTSWERKAKKEAMLFSLTALLSHKFGELSEALQVKLQKLSSEQLQSLFVVAVKFESKTELTAWLKRYTNGAPGSARVKRTKAMSV